MERRPATSRRVKSPAGVPYGPARPARHVTSKQLFFAMNPDAILLRNRSLTAGLLAIKPGGPPLPMDDRNRQRPRPRLLGTWSGETGRFERHSPAALAGAIAPSTTILELVFQADQSGHGPGA